jgi:leucyl aminopeptidase
VGAGKKADFEPRVARNLAGSAARKTIKLGAKKLAIYQRSEVDSEEIIEGVGQANYDPGLYKTKKETSAITELLILGSAKKQTIKHSQVVTESTNWVRKLISEPPNIMTPSKMVEEARKLARDYKFGIEVIDEKEAQKKGMGAFVGIAKGSDEASYMVVLKYKGGGKETLGIAGKGITFDTGGLSLKPSNRLTDMKMDMAGAAAAFGAMKVVGELRPKVNVVAVCPITENMPSGKALKPDDVVRSLSGKTIEITNTDAEGRVVLADAVNYAQKLGATKIIDLATLTGAVLVIFGNEAAAIMGKPQSWIDFVMKASEEAGERMWQLPMYDEYKMVLKSDIADVANAYKSHPSAGTIAGGVFLQEFIKKEVNWAHLDIAGTAWLETEKPFVAKGPTGYGVRTLVKLIEGLESAS